MSEEEIKSFLEGSNSDEFIVSVEFDYKTNSIYKIKETPDGVKTLERDTFTPFAWTGDLKDLNFYNGSKEQQRKAISKYGITIEKLETGGNERLENGLNFLIKSLKGYRELQEFFKDGGLDIWSEKVRPLVIMLNPVEQYLISKEKRIFKGFKNYNEITRMVFDLETTALDPMEGRIFMIGIKTNKGYHKVINCPDEETEKEGIITFFKIINEIKPTIIGGYNSANFDWPWLIKRCEVLGIDIKKELKTLNPNTKLSITNRMLKLGNEVENFDQIKLWGYSIVDIIHSVRRAQAINSDIKSASLKYITKFIEAEAADRVYIDHNKIGPMYNKNESFWLNVSNGNYRKDSEEFKDLDKKFPGTFIKTTGSDIVERYLDDDLEETLKVDDEYNQASFFLASLVPVSYEKAMTMGTAGLWKMLLLAWSYKHKIAIPKKSKKRSFVGGLPGLLSVGYSENFIKLDFSSLYPSIQLLHDIFPECDITGVFKKFLSFFRNKRIEYKNLSKELKKIDPEQSKSYDIKQLPIKIFINSLYGSLSAPEIFDWADIDKGEQITCTGRQYLRLMIKFFLKRGYSPLVLDTDGCNFKLPENVEERRYIGKGTGWDIEKDFEYKGFNADIAEFNETFMGEPMSLSLDGHWVSCINFSKKNYATLDKNGKIKLTGNTIKSKKLPIYIEEFMNTGIKLLLEGKGLEFIEYYYSYIEKIHSKDIPLLSVAQRSKVKLSIKEYIERSKKVNKAGHQMSMMAHMELAIKHNLDIKMGDVIHYVNNGIKISDGDVEKKGDEKKLNAYLLNEETLETNPDLRGEFNVARTISNLNKRIKPLLVVFDEDIRNSILIKNPNERNLFSKEQCKLISGKPFKETDQETIDEILTLSKEEEAFWEKANIDKNYILREAKEGWKSLV